MLSLVIWECACAISHYWLQCLWRCWCW